MIIPKGSTSSKLVHCFIEDFGNFVYNFSTVELHCILFYLLILLHWYLIFLISVLFNNHKYFIFPTVKLP